MFLNLVHEKLVVFGAVLITNNPVISIKMILQCNNKDENPYFVLDIKDKFKPEAVKNIKEFYQQEIGFPDKFSYYKYCI